MATKSSGGGISLLGALGLLFVGLKLGGVINWSWWYVTLPFWGGLVLLALIFAAALVIGGIAAIVKHNT